jgi:hypothetical protein
MGSKVRGEVILGGGILPQTFNAQRSTSNAQFSRKIVAFVSVCRT